MAPAHTMDSGERIVTRPGGRDSDTTAVVKEVIAIQTGYAPDMLAEDLDLEADLGIDTVKQVEIFGKVASKFGFAVPDDLRLRDLNTIEKLAAYIQTQVPAAPVPAEEPIPATGSASRIGPMKGTDRMHMGGGHPDPEYGKARGPEYCR